MSTRLYKELPLTELKPNPFNPRKRFSGPEYDELVASIKTKGVLEPILVRPDAGAVESSFEIIAGERRYRASCDVARANGGIEHAVIPAMIQEMSDDEAFDAMTIENLQRADLTELEEARGFQIYLEHKGPDALKELSERVGIDPRYIRRRTAVLSLSNEILESWEKGEICYGHLEQLIRVDDKELCNKYFESIKKYDYTVATLKSQIDSRSPLLKKAEIFDKDEKRCRTCQHNTKVQRDLFGDQMAADKSRCLNPKCFKQRLSAFLDANWGKFRTKRNLHTNGYRFDDTLNYSDYESMTRWDHGDIKEKCLACPSLVTIIDDVGDYAPYQQTVCIDKACYRSTFRQSRSGTASIKDENAPRVAWHGEFFREEFYKTRIPEVLSTPEVSNFARQQLLFLSLLISNSEAAGSFIEKFINDKNRYRYYGNNNALAKKILDLEETPENEAWLQDRINETTAKIIMQAQSTAPVRHAVAARIGIDLRKEWQISEEYLKKKTIKEMLAIGEKTALFQDEKAINYLTEVTGKTFATCKKKELIDVFLNSGADLAGRVPDEILNAG
jgi:ParB/RepB/Spo0J family partition protein